MTDSYLSFWVPVGSLVVAALAVVVGPIVSWRIARHESDAALTVARKQIVAPLRQAWIDSLRTRVAKFIGKASSFHHSGLDAIEKGVDAEYIEGHGRTTQRKLTFLITQIELMLNVKEPDHVALLVSLRNVRRLMWPHDDNRELFPQAVSAAVALSQSVLKREWERVKNDEI